MMRVRTLGFIRSIFQLRHTTGAKVSLVTCTATDRCRHLDAQNDPAIVAGCD